MLLDIRLPPKTEAAGLARRALEELPRRFNGALTQLQLAVTELVTNAVRHARLKPTDEIELVVRHADHRVRVEVKDPGRGHDAAVAGWNHIPQGFSTENPATGSFGLFVVREIVDRSGVDWDDGTVAWFELDTAKS